jgi:hypothetical protein
LPPIKKRNRKPAFQGIPPLAAGRFGIQRQIHERHEIMAQIGWHGLFTTEAIGEKRLGHLQPLRQVGLPNAGLLEEGEHFRDVHPTILAL